MAEEKIYSTQEINEIINFDDPTGRGSGQARLIPRCKRAGLILETVKVKGNKNAYKIISNNINLENEIWVDCYLKNDWEVSNLGRVRKKKGKQPLGVKNQQGYVTICTTLESGKTTQVQVHRLVYFSFHPSEYSDNMVIDHINGQRNDNRLDNLRCLTNVQNTKERDINQTQVKTLTTELVIKYGYEKVAKYLEKGLTILEDVI